MLFAGGGGSGAQFILPLEPGGGGGGMKLFPPKSNGAVKIGFDVGGGP